MKKIVKDNKTYNIDCEDNMCGNCNFKPEPLMLKCELFDINLDHVRGDYPSNSGWKRHSECINAEKNNFISGYGLMSMLDEREGSGTIKGDGSTPYEIISGFDR